MDPRGQEREREREREIETGSVKGLPAKLYFGEARMQPIDGQARLIMFIIIRRASEKVQMPDSPVDASNGMVPLQVAL